MPSLTVQKNFDVSQLHSGTSKFNREHEEAVIARTFGGHPPRLDGSINSRLIQFLAGTNMYLGLKFDCGLQRDGGIFDPDKRIKRFPSVVIVIVEKALARVLSL